MPQIVGEGEALASKAGNFGGRRGSEDCYPLRRRASSAGALRIVDDELTDTELFVALAGLADVVFGYSSSTSSRARVGTLPTEVIGAKVVQMVADVAL
jgi:hypothetical protein